MSLYPISGKCDAVKVRCGKIKILLCVWMVSPSVSWGHQSMVSTTPPKGIHVYRTILTVNAVLGDQSNPQGSRLRVRGGISEKLRIQKHLRYVHTLLTKRPTRHLSAHQRSNRAALLAILDRYEKRGRFPRHRTSFSSNRQLRTPLFRDHRARFCAVGELMALSGALPLAKRIAETSPFVFILDVREPDFLRWQENSGFSLRELAMIQPAYGIGARKHIGKMLDGKRHGPWILASCLRSVGAPAVLEKGSYLKGKRTGVWRKYICKSWRYACSIKRARRCQKLSTIGSYSKGKRHGAWKYLYQKSGKVRRKGQFKMGRAYGRWITYTSGGKISSTSQYKRGVRHGKWTGWRMVNRSGYYKRIWMRGRYRWNRMHGPWIWFLPKIRKPLWSDNRRELYTYRKGAKAGLKAKWNHKGWLTEQTYGCSSIYWLDPAKHKKLSCSAFTGCFKRKSARFSCRKRKRLLSSRAFKAMIKRLAF